MAAGQGTARTGARKRRTAPKTGPRARGAKSAANDASAARSERDEALETALVVDGTPYRLADLTLNELGELEEHVGLPMQAISFGSAKVMAFVIYTVRRRDNPDYTLADAGNIKIGDVRSHKPSDDDEQPDDREVIGTAGRPTGAEG